MGDHGSRPPSGAPPSGGASSSGPPPDELIRLLADRFERLEASIGHMETNLALGQVSTAHSTSDVIHTIGEDGEVKSISLDESGGMDGDGMDAVHSGPDLLDLYEAQSLALNPFLRSKDSVQGPGVDPAKIAALILDNLSGSDAQSFIQAAAKSGFLSANEAKTLSGITSLAEPGESSGNATLPNRPLLIFVAMVDAWRSQSSSSNRQSSIPSAPMVDVEPGE